jgi:putative ABC transport system permease protein
VTRLLTLASRNLFRHRARTSTALAAVAFGVAALILSGGFVQDLYFQLGEALIRSQSGHLQVARPEYFAEGSRAPERHRIAAPQQVKDAIVQVAGVTNVMARLSFSGLLSNGRVDVPVVGQGVEPGQEAALTTAIRLLSGRALAEGDTYGIEVGEGLAHSLAIGPGDSVTVLASTVDGALNTVEFEVVGVFRSFSREYDGRALRISLAAAQELLATQDANLIVVLLDRTERTDAAYQETAARVLPLQLTVKRWEEINDFYANTVALYDRQFAVLRLIVLVMVVLGVANAVNMGVFERMGEFGTMRALGNRGRFVVGLILSECLLLGLAGAAIGALVGSLLAGAISLVGIPMPPPPNSNVGYTAEIRLLPEIVAQAFAVGIVATVFSGVIPALRARRVAIVDALRTAI